jgi:Arc/MetJ-type ribon-helix-helix transcriptional regulator
MREPQATISLYVRVDETQDAAIREAVRASPVRYGSISDFVRTAINNQLKRERSSKHASKAPKFI